MILSCNKHLFSRELDKEFVSKVFITKEVYEACHVSFNGGTNWFKVEVVKQMVVSTI